MDKLIKKKWMMVFGIWCGVLLLTLLNFYEIEHIKEDIFNTQIRKMEQQYISGHSEEMDRIFHEEAQLYHEIESIGIGILVVENQLRRLTESHQLEDMRLEARSEDNGNQETPLKLYVSGALPDMVSFLQHLKSDTPFLIISQIDWTGEMVQRNLQFSLQLYYRYRFVNKGQEV